MYANRKSISFLFCCVNGIQPKIRELDKNVICGDGPAYNCTFSNNGSNYRPLRCRRKKSDATSLQNKWRSTWRPAQRMSQWERLSLCESGPHRNLKETPVMSLRGNVNHLFISCHWNNLIALIISVPQKPSPLSDLRIEKDIFLNLFFCRQFWYRRPIRTSPIPFSCACAIQLKSQRFSFRPIQLEQIKTHCCGFSAANILLFFFLATRNPLISLRTA